MSEPAIEVELDRVTKRFERTEDDVKDALKRMRKYKIKRLCVINQDKELHGIISLSDILLKAGEKKSVRKLIFSTLEAIARPAPIVLKEENAAVKD